MALSSVTGCGRSRSGRERLNVKIAPFHRCRSLRGRSPDFWGLLPLAYLPRGRVCDRPVPPASIRRAPRQPTMVPSFLVSQDLGSGRRGLLLCFALAEQLGDGGSARLPQLLVGLGTTLHGPWFTASRSVPHSLLVQRPHE